MNIYLVGYRCTGKTTVGKRLAEKLEWEFVDTDRYIETQAGLRISEIVSRYGWPDFRKREAEATAELANADLLVVATGGGVVLDPENVRVIRKSGFIVWLKASVETIYTRMRQDPETCTQRPALTDFPLAEEIRETLSRRVPLYARACDLSVDTDHMEVEAICGEVIQKMRCLHAG